MPSEADESGDAVKWRKLNSTTVPRIIYINWKNPINISPNKSEQAPKATDCYHTTFVQHHCNLFHYMHSVTSITKIKKKINYPFRKSGHAFY